MDDKPERLENPLPHPAADRVRRHRLSTRIWHWINALTVIIMLMSGLMILNAHPRLYWGAYGANSDPAWLTLGAEGAAPVPGWITIPSTYSPATARLWHLSFAWVLAAGLLAYLVWSLLNGHLRRDIAPRSAELTPRHLWQDICDHARLRFPKGEAAARYNILQKLAYGGVLLIVLPLVILTGLAMSPAIDALWHGLPDAFGGRQSARSIHFLCAAALVAFFIVHMAMVLLAGPVNEVRSMITGWFDLPPDPADKGESDHG